MEGLVRPIAKESILDSEEILKNLVHLLARQAASEILLLQTKEDDNGTEANED